MAAGVYCVNPCGSQVAPSWCCCLQPGQFRTGPATLGTSQDLALDTSHLKVKFTPSPLPPGLLLCQVLRPPPPPPGSQLCQDLLQIV
jgi:hypothetical protein